MQRRELLIKSLLTGVAGLSSWQGLGKNKDKKYRWRMVLTVPKTLPIWGEAIKQFADRVGVMSQGQLQIHIYGASELIPASGVFEAVKSGRVEMAHAASYYWQGNIPETSFYCHVPFGMNVNGMRAWLSYGGGQELWDELYHQHGLKALPAGHIGMQMGGWFKKEITDVSDFKNLKIHTPGLGSQIMARLGAKPVLVPGEEIYTNLATGVIDAIEWLGPYHDYTMGFHKVAKNYYYPGWQEPTSVLELIIHRNSWQQLPRHLQEIVKTAATALDTRIGSQWLAQDSLYLKKIQQDGQVQLQAFPMSVLRHLKQIAQDVKNEVGQTSRLAKKIYLSYMRFQKLYEEHSRLAFGSFPADTHKKIIPTQEECNEKVVLLSGFVE